MAAIQTERKVALFIDVENLFINAKEDKQCLQIDLVVNQARREGRLIFAKAYADWTQPMLHKYVQKLRAEGVQLELLSSDQKGKNTADIQLALDAFELCLSPYCPDTFILATGDRDMIPLVQKLKMRSIRVVGVGIAGRVSKALQPLCDEYVLYHDLQPNTLSSSSDQAVKSAPMTQGVKPKAPAPAAVAAPGKKSSPPLPTKAKPVAPAKIEPPDPDLEPAFKLLAQSLNNILTANEVAQGTKVYNSMRKLEPTFTLQKHQLKTLKAFFLKANQAGLITFSGKENGNMVLNLTKKGKRMLVPSTPPPSPQQSPVNDDALVTT